jgi:hypothetical protein
LQDAVLYFRQIDPEGRRDAVIETISGRTFAAEDIDRLRQETR